MMIYCCEQLNIEYERMQIKPIYSRRTLLRSAHLHKKFRTEYEIRTFTQVLRLNYLTGSSYNALVGYFQMNIPYGVNMKVHKYELLEAPESIPVQNLKRKNLDDVVKFRPREIDFEPYVTSRHYFAETFNNLKPKTMNRGPFWEDPV